MPIDRSQADAIAQAVLQPDLDAQAALQQRRAREALHLARQRRAAAIALVGMAIGGTAGQLLFEAFSRGVIVGGVLAFLGARLLQRRMQ